MLLMNDITKITIIFAAILVILMIVLVIVTVKVLKGGKDVDDEEGEDIRDTVKKAMSDDGEGQDDDDEYYEDDEADAEVEAETEEPVEEEAETEEETAYEEAVSASEDTSEDTTDYGDESDDDIYDDDSYNEPTDDISEIQKEVRRVDPGYVDQDTLVMDELVDEVKDREALIDSEFADSAFAPKSVADKLAATVAKADEEKKAEYEAHKAAKRASAGAEQTSSKVVADTVKIPAVSDDVVLPKAEVDETAEYSAADDSSTDSNVAEEAVSDISAEDSAFADSAFGDSAFGDSAFGEQPEEKEEHIHPLPETSQTIPVNPVNAVNISTVNSVDTVNTTNESAGISDMNQVKDFLEENPVPKRKRRKIKKKEQEFIKKFGDLEPHFKNGSCYWYNNQDIENLTKKEDMYFYCHYFNEPEDAVMPLIVEMYDCAFVRTEEIQYIAYGVRFKSMNFRQIINTKEHIDFDITTATKTPTEDDKMLIYEKWRGYVDKFMEIIVFNAPDQVREEIIEKMYEYGRNDVDDLMVSPE